MDFSSWPLFFANFWEQIQYVAPLEYMEHRLSGSK